MDSFVSWSCNVGWTGWLCNEDLDECLAKPCANNGLCLQTEEPGMYTCECTDQYQGHNCEQLKNRTCEDKPCREDAQCFNETSEYDNGCPFQFNCLHWYFKSQAYKKIVVLYRVDN